MIEQNMLTAFKVTLKERGQLVENWLSTCLSPSSTEQIAMCAMSVGRDLPHSLREAMEYSLLAGGKRIRPILCLTTAKLCGLHFKSVLPFASAIEMIHSYSLIHDDLPAMDNGDLRRGKPSNHKQFDEATAILAGDALLTEAFVFMCSLDLPAEHVLRALRYMARAAGAHGMVGGQMLDMDYTGQNNLSLESLRNMHSMKTGALLQASCVCGALLANAPQKTIQALEIYGAALGSAFQIADDILDITADTKTLGKPSGSDAEKGKNTYPSLMGLEASKNLANEQKQVALNSLSGMIGEDVDFLRTLACYVVERNS